MRQVAGLSLQAVPSDRGHGKGEIGNGKHLGYRPITLDGGQRRLRLGVR